MLGTTLQPEVDKMPSLYELSKISLNAAIQLDRLIKGREADLQPLQLLTGALRHTSESQSAADARVLQCNPTTIGVMSRALTDSGNKLPNTVADLARDIADYVAHFSGELNDSELLQRLRAFCVSLHRELAAEITKRDLRPNEDLAGSSPWILVSSPSKN